MKYTILFCVLITITFCNAQIVYIANPWLKANILSTNTTTNLRAKDLLGNWLQIDQNNDGEIQVSEALNVSYYTDANALYVSSYEGINSFLNLETLIFAYNQTPAYLNLSGLIHLKYLMCYMNNLSSINLTGCNELEELHLDQNYLTTLDLSGLQNLKTVRCQNNFLSSLNIDETPSLISLICFNNYITTLNISENPNLVYLYVDRNNLTDLNLNNCTNLNELRCDSNNLQTLDVSNLASLNQLSCSYNNISTLNINNGFNWNPGTTFIGNYNPAISLVCTSTASVSNLLNYYSSYTTNISDCSVLKISENQIQKLLFYPNPAIDKIFFNKNVNAISVYNVHGQLVKSSILNTLEMDISDLNSGIYLMEILSENGIKSEKLIIK